MKNGAVLLVVAGGVLALVGWVLLRPVAVVPPAESQLFADYSVRTEKETGWARVQLWWESTPEMKARWRAKKAARITLTGGEAFSGDTHIPRERLREFLDQRVSTGEIDYVVIFPVKGAKFGEILPALDECRKSRVQIVLLNQYEL